MKRNDNLRRPNSVDALDTNVGLCSTRTDIFLEGQVHRLEVVDWSMEVH